MSNLNSNLKAPRPPMIWDHTPATIHSAVEDSISRSKSLKDKIAALSTADANFETVFLPLALDEGILENATQPLTFYQYVSTDKDLRDAATEAEIRLNEHNIVSAMRLDVFKSLQAAKKNIDKSGKILKPEEARLVERMLMDGKRDGLDLPEETRTKVTSLKKELSNVCTEFSKNFNEEKGTISFTLAQLKGVPQDVISGYTKSTPEGGSEELYKVTFKTPDIFPIFKFAQDPETRRAAVQASESKLEINVPLLARAVDLRRQLAGLYGYDTWADYVEEPMMIKTSKAVKEFLDDLETKLYPLGIQERKTLLQYKHEEHAKLGYEPSNEFYLWDYRYYDNQFVERTLSLDDNVIKEYFPVDVVVPTILEIYQDLLGVRFREVKDGSLWHPEVQHFEVWEADSKTDADFLGYVYLDLYPREAKYSHAAVWPLVLGYEKEDGSRNYPVTGMVANLAKPTADRPALMRHSDVVTFFHEMGHVFHGLLSRTKFSRFHGTNVARDFVEAPSQMLENWCWEKKVLKRMSSHYKTKEPLSDDLIEKLIKSRNVNIALFSLRQLFFGKFDIHIHTDKDSSNNDYSKLYCQMREKISLVKTGDKITPGQGSFGHLTSGYDAGYYGYLYSQVFSADMYYEVFEKDPMSSEAGKRYRDRILLPGGSRDEMHSLKEFLGRAPNADAFLKSILGSSHGTSTSNL